jgi:hypothetical protein
MKKIIVPSFFLYAFLFTDNILNAQGKAGNTDLAATSGNVVMWTKDVLPKMEQLSAKLEKIKPANAKDIESQKIFLKALQTLREINIKGAKLTAAEARRHDAWFKGVVKTFYIECQSHNGNVCCVDCHNHGILGIWCYANCFVASFPWPD